MTLLRAFLTVSAFTSLSRVFGFIRDILMAAILGAGPLMEIFVVAFKLPNFFRRLFAEGAFNAAFVPMYARLRSRDAEEARRFSEQSLTVLCLVLLVFTVVMQFLMPWALYVLAPGFAPGSEKYSLAVQLCRVTFPYLLLISIVSLLAGLLNSVGRYGSGAFAPVLLNLCMITGLLLVDRLPGTAAHVLSYAVLIAGGVQLLWLMLAAKRAGILPRLVRPRLSPEVRQLFRRMVPGIIGSGIVQVNLWVDVMIATLIPGAVAYLYYADRLSQLPLAVIGTAVGTALLPMLARQFEQNETEEALQTQNQAILLAMLFTLPAMVGLIVTAMPLIQTLFERGAFDAATSHATAWAMIAYAVGLPAFVLVKVLTPGFFANGDTKTPVKYAMVAMLVNVVLNIVAVVVLRQLAFMPHMGIALATSIAAWLNVALLARRLKQLGYFTLHPETRLRLWKCLFASGVCGLVLVGLLEVLPPFAGAGQGARVLMVIALISAGIVSYFMVVFLTGAYHFSQLRRVLTRARK
ncbi:MAG: murein biosynthesis integral membrane protein MurJ [Hyphomicrobiales bacterium]|nr:murein biosynthesis integral membrane protein MurJ [Hyphomicrobiales bacterium]